MPLDPNVYAQMLGEKIDHGGVRVYLINTGWTGGPYGTGKRMKLAYTRKMVEAAQSGIIDDCEFVHDERFNLDVPTTCPGVPSELLNARNTWEDRAAYDEMAEKLAQMFVDNAEKPPHHDGARGPPPPAPSPSWGSSPLPMRDGPAWDRDGAARPVRGGRRLFSCG